ncbi:MAG: PAS domain S-box protein, partial [Verrucomicrobiota bacterium]
MATTPDFLSSDFADIIRMAPDAVVVHDMENCVLYWNRLAEDLYGWSNEEILGRPIDRIFYLDTKKRESVIIEMRDVGEWQGELRQIDRGGDEHLVLCRQRLIRDESGEPVSIVSFNTDVTERRKLQDAEARAHHVRSSSLLAGGIAHDLNNALAPIMLSSAMLKRSIDDPKSLGMVSMIEKCASRGAELISHLLAFERGKGGGNEVLRATQVQRAVKRSAEELLPENVELKFDIPDDFWEFRGESTEIGQIFHHLMQNACEAMPSGG